MTFGKMCTALAVAVAGATTVALPAAAQTAASAAAPRVVPIKGIAFHPGTLVVKRGDAVQWKWLDPETPHNVTSRGSLRFRNSGTKQEGSTYQVTFNKKGTYGYVCTIHLNMKGKVVVR